MKTKLNVEELERQIDFEGVSSRLIELSESGELKRKKTIADLLDRVKPALLQSRDKKVSFKALAKFLRDSGIPVSEPTLRQYLNGAKAVKRRGKKKSAAPKVEPAAKTPVVES